MIRTVAGKTASSMTKGQCDGRRMGQEGRCALPNEVQIDVVDDKDEENYHAQHPSCATILPGLIISCSLFVRDDN
jgi:hypothetical protein